MGTETRWLARFAASDVSWQSARSSSFWGGTLDLLLSDDTVGDVAQRGLFVVAFIIVVTLLANAAQRHSRRRPRER
jgi:hypothetical protein